MSDSEESILNTSQQDNRAIDLPVLADAQDGSEILFAMARLLEEKHGEEYGYALLLRQTAHAVRDITDQMQPWVVANEIDPVVKELWQDVSPRDSVMGAGDHRSQIAFRLGLHS